LIMMTHRLQHICDNHLCLTDTAEVGRWG
jgi:hypothetical protein